MERAWNYEEKLEILYPIFSMSISPSFFSSVEKVSSHPKPRFIIMRTRNFETLMILQQTYTSNFCGIPKSSVASSSPASFFGQI
jgi:hypothetical protein